MPATRPTTPPENTTHEIVYPMSVEYVANWNTERAIAELVANAFDEDPRPRITYHDGRLTISDRGAGWTEDTFILGKSGKDDHQIGQFGEGLKLALLVLARENRNVIVETAGRIITARIETRSLAWDSNTRGHDLLCLQTSPRQGRTGRPPTGTRIHIDCSSEDARAVFERFLRLENPRYRTPDSGNVLPDKPGRIYLGGVLVTADRDLRMGYDFPLARAKRLIGRDRNVIDGWELETLIGDAVGSSRNREAIATYIHAALTGQLGSSENGAARRLNNHSGTDPLWRSITRQLLSADTARVDTSAVGTIAVDRYGRPKTYWDERTETLEIHTTLLDQQWTRIPPTIGGSCHSELMRKMGIRHVSSITRERDQLTWTPRQHLTSAERRNLSLMLRRAHRLVGNRLKVRIFEAHENPDLRGFFDLERDIIAIRRDQLTSRQHLAEVLVHEIAHRQARLLGREWHDRTRGFEETLTEYAALALTGGRTRHE